MIDHVPCQVQKYNHEPDKATDQHESDVEQRGGPLRGQAGPAVLLALSEQLTVDLLTWSILCCSLAQCFLTAICFLGVYDAKVGFGFIHSEIGINNELSGSTPGSWSIQSILEMCKKKKDNIIFKCLRGLRLRF